MGGDQLPPLVDPPRVFASPLDIVTADFLSNSQKLDALRRWDELLQSRLRSSAEGMTASDGDQGDDAVMADQIAQAMRLLNDSSARPTDVKTTATTGIGSHGGTPKV